MSLYWQVVIVLGVMLGVVRFASECKRQKQERLAREAQARRLSAMRGGNKKPTNSANTMTPAEKEEMKRIRREAMNTTPFCERPQ